MVNMDINPAIPDYVFPKDPNGRTIMMTDYDLRDYEENVKKIRSLVLDHNGYINSIHEGDFCVLTTKNDQSFETLADGYGALPYQFVQNPQGAFHINEDSMIGTTKHGEYDVSFCFQLTSSINRESRRCRFTFTAYDKDSKAIGKPLIITASRNAFGHYPSIAGTFKGILLGPEGDLDKKVCIKCTAIDPHGEELDPGVLDSTLDPYKNYVVVEPSDSITKAGLMIAKSLKDTLSGLSFRNGFEVRATIDKRNHKTPRTYGEKYNTRVITATATREGESSNE